MIEETPLDRAHAAMRAAPEDEGLRRRFLERLADTEVSVLLDGDAGQESWRPAVYPVEGGDYVLGFDSDARLAEFSGDAADFAALPGRTLAELLAGQGLGLGLNLGVAPSSMLLPPEMIRWMAEALSLAPAATQLPERLTRGIPPAPLLVALSSRLEKAGGLAAQIASGALKADVEKAASERAKNVARRKDALTGASEFPNIAEKPVTVLAPMPATTTPAGALAAHRLSEPYEALRDKSDALAAKGKRPSVFLANIGPIAAFTARATFAKNFFEAGGIEAPGNDGFGSAETAADAYAASGAPIACICSSDAIYAEQAEAVARALKAKGAKLVILAGRAGDKEAAFTAAGVGDYVFAGADVLGCLDRVWKAIA
ncbi:MAG: SseB family protein [Rhodoblastus sp.]|nr:SseB family protein [Rhodoblastus sp.]